MICDKCTNDKSIENCGKCRKITKHELVKMVLGLYDEPEAILLKSQRNTTGSRSCKKISIDSLEYSILWYYNNTDYSYRKIAVKLGVSASSVFNVVHGKRKKQGQ